MTDPLAAAADLPRVLALLTPVRDHLASAAAAPPRIDSGWQGPAARAATDRDVELASALREAAHLAAEVVEGARRRVLVAG